MDVRNARGRAFLLLVIALAAPVGVCLALAPAAGGDGAATKPAFHLYDGFAADVALMRKTEALDPKGGKPVRASSAEAVAAARRIFERVSFLFRTRAEILALLGDPASVSGYNEPAGTTGPLKYRFDTGYNGFEVTIGFGRGEDVARRVSVEAIE